MSAKNKAVTRIHVVRHTRAHLWLQQANQVNWRQFARKYFVGLLVALTIPVIATGTYAYYQHQQNVVMVDQQAFAPFEHAVETSQPTTVKIAEAGIDLDITPAYITKGEWETSFKTASHLASSANPGEGSNVVIYGHNRPHLFKNLHQVEKGQIITITTEKNVTYEYIVDQIDVVKPNEIEVVLPTEHELLTLYTCTSFLDRERLVIKARPSKVTASL